MVRNPLHMLPRLLAATWCMVGVVSWVESAGRVEAGVEGARTRCGGAR